MNKSFSIITITWNNAEGLQRTLKSIRKLDYADKELIVVDGGSTDNTSEIIEDNKDIITTFVSEKDSGIYNAMNKGVKLVNNEYVVFMNAGDCFSGKDALDIVNKCDGDIILGSSKYGDSLHLAKQKEMTLYDVLSIGINHQSTYYSADIIKKYGFDEKYKLIADLKSVVEPMAKDNIIVISIPDILSVCEGGGLSKRQWRNIIVEKRQIIEDVVAPYYKLDYLRFACINNDMLEDFCVLSYFSSVFPVIKLLSKVMKFMNRHFKHIPID